MKETWALKVLHCPDLVGGNPYGIAKAERAIGLTSHCVALRPHPFGYPADQILSSGSEISAQIARWRLLALAMGDYNVIHFNFGQSTMPQRIPEDASWKRGYPTWIRRSYNLYASILELKDLRLLKRMGKCVVMTYQGDDARQGDFLRSRYKISPADESGYYTQESDSHKRERIETVSQYADAIFALNPDLLHVLPARARFMPYANLDIASIQPVPPRSRAIPVVVHAPSHQGVKGTRFILDAVKRLKSEGIRFEFVLLEGLSHAEAMRLYADADLLIDQLLVGWYGGLGVELMALGKPVICYVREEDLCFIDPEMRSQLPVIRAEPGTIYEVLKECLISPRHKLAELGALSRTYVERWHDPLRIAASLKEAYETAVRR